MNDIFPEDPIVTPARLASLVLAFIYVAVGLLLGGPATAAKLGCFTVLPLLCIWFPDVLGSYTGWGLGVSSIPITRETPEVFVYYGGWVLLFLPVITGILVALLS